jgi:outer membrane receptor protein involved in Fe transport
MKTLLLATVGASLLVAQIEQANLTGLVIDESGAVVPGAAVSLVNLATRVRQDTETNSAGGYRLPFLAAGQYDLSVTKTGFDAAKVTGIRLTVGLTATVNVTLRTGTVQQEVTVSATAVQLEQQSSTLGNTVSGKQMIELPLLGRNPYSLVLLAPGVLPRGNAGSGPIINGGRSNTSEILLDGAETRNATTNDIAFVPPLETVAEFKVMTNAFSSEFGRSGGGVLTVATRSGTNELHGSAYEFIRNDKLNANSWASNRAGLPRNSFRRNEYGFSVGGPVVLPKLYDGRNRTFFFTNFEWIPQRAPDNILATVPTALERSGDFSRTVTTANQLIRIFDPLTTVPNPSAAGEFIRTQFPDNKIPASRIDPAAVKILGYYPPANRETVVQNFAFNNSRANDTNKQFFRVDQAMGAKQRLFVTLGRQYNQQFTPGFNVAFPGEGTNGEQGQVQSKSISTVATDTVTFTPSLIGQFRVSATRRIISTQLRSAGFDITTLGFSPALKAKAKTLIFPRIGPADVAALGADRASFYVDAEGNYEGQAHMTWLRGGHSMKFGYDYMFQYFNIFRPERPSGQYDFSRTFTQGPNPTMSAATAGHGVATFLLGAPTGGTFSDDPTLATSQRYYASYFQDDWKVRRDLTLNLGVRWEYQAPWTDRFNQLGYFDPDFTDPLTKQKGLLRFTGRDGNPRHQTNPDKNNIAPRIGLAWQLKSKTVVRAGYGMFYFPGSGGVGAGASDLGSGFLTQTPVFLGPPPAAPNTPPVGASMTRAFEAGFFDAPSTSVGAGIGTAFREWVTPYNHQWNFNIQQALTPTLLFEAAYVGNRGQRIWINRNRSAVPAAAVSLGAALDGLVDNPYFGVITTGALSTRQVRRSALMQPFNHYTGVSRFRDPVGDSIYHGFTLRLDKQFSHGLSFQAAFTGSKQIDNVQERFGGRSTFIDPNNLGLSRSTSEEDRPRHFIMNYIYELPFGPGKTFAKSGVVSHLLGRWQLSGVTTFSRGLPMVITGPNNTRVPGVSAMAVRLKDPVLPEGQRTLDRWFDTTAFAPAPTYSIGNDSRTQPQLRIPGIKTFDVNMSRTQVIKERVTVQFRAEWFNALNTPQFGAPNGNVTATNFGQITGASNTRVVQLGLRLAF